MKTKNRFRIYLWSRGEHSRLFRVGISKRPSRRKSFIPVINLNSFQAAGHFLIIQMNGLSSLADNSSQNKPDLQSHMSCLAPLSFILYFSPMNLIVELVVFIRTCDRAWQIEADLKQKQRSPLSSLVF